MKKYIIASLAGLLALTSCRLDENLNPNKPVSSAISLKQRLAAAQTSTYAVQAGRMNALGNLWMNAWTGNNYQYGNPATDETNLTLHSGFYAGIWNDMYRAVTRFQVMIDSDQAAQAPNHVAIAKIMKAYYMQYIVDLYGDVPYSEAFKEAAIVTPTYDNDADVYKALATELMDAITLINNSGSADFAVSATEDVMLGGKMAEWKKFANTILLKYAVRLSNTTDATGIATRNEILGKLAGAQFLTADVKIQPGYNSSTAASQNPLYNWFGRQTATGSSNTGGYLLYRASDHIVKSLTGDPNKITAGVSDPRAAFLFTTAKEYCTGITSYQGLVQGAGKAPDDCPDGTKRANGSFSGFGGIFAQAAGPGSSAPGVVMFLSESELLQAEAAVYYPGTFSGGQSHFDKAVNASFIADGLTAVDAAAYLAAIAGKPQVGWGATKEDQLAAIQYQRWIALTNYNAIETFINYKKTGYPVTPLSLSTSKTTKPFRLVYPASEYSANAANVPQMTGDDVFDRASELTPFWYK